MYLLNPGMGFEINGITCEDLTDLIEYLERVDDDKRDETADRLVEK